MNGFKTLNEISSSIRSTRRTLGISQKALAAYLGISQSTIARLESDIDSLNPSYRMVFNVIEALNELGERSKAEAFTDKTAKEVMHRKVVFCRDTDTIKFALELIKDKDFSQLPVLNRSGSVVGTVYQKNLLMAHMNNTENRKKRVSEILDPALPQIDENTPIRKLKSLMEGYDAILVTEKGKLKGIISVFDMLRVL